MEIETEEIRDFKITDRTILALASAVSNKTINI